MVRLFSHVQYFRVTNLNEPKDWSSGLTNNLWTQLKSFAREKHSSLIQRSISDEEKKVFRIFDIWDLKMKQPRKCQNWTKLFSN